MFFKYLLTKQMPRMISKQPGDSELKWQPATAIATSA